VSVPAVPGRAKAPGTRERLVMDDGIEPWEKQPRETPPMFERFALYRDAGVKRSVRAIAEQAGRSVTYMQHLAWRNRWHDRVSAWEVEGRRLRALYLREELDRMVDEQLKMSRALNVMAAMGLKSVKPDDMKITEILRMIELASKLERNALGEPERIVAVQGGVPGAPPIMLSTSVPASEEERAEFVRVNLLRLASLADDDEAVLNDMSFFELDEDTPR
jgi:hypothetical protein